MYTILFVDDEPTLLDVGKRFLERSPDLSVTTAESSQQGLDLLRRQSFDAIVSDYEMPLKDGIAFLQEVRLSYSTLPFILFTGKSREDVVIRALNSGADFYLQKGGDPKSQFAELIHAIRTAIGRRRSEDDLRTLINSMPDIVCFKDGEGRYLETNEFDLHLFQIEGVPYRGKKDAELAQYSDFYRDAFLACESSDETAWEKREMFRTEEAIPRPDGTVMTFDVIKIPLFYSDGRRKGLVVIGRDITEQKRLKTALEEALRRGSGLAGNNRPCCPHP